MTDHTAYRARRDEILKNLHADWVRHPSNYPFAFAEAAKELDSLFLEVVGEDEWVPPSAGVARMKRVMHQDSLRASIRKVIQGDKEVESK